MSEETATSHHLPDFKLGRLTIVGSGLASISQMTLEALSYIENATKVFYCVGDPVTEAFIRSKNKDCEDLYKYYDNSKPRQITYIQMAEVMLREVRAGCDVVGVFYGHPGVFVAPSHRAIAIAREEGYRAKMLPGISAEDCLYADLGIDPAKPGCVIYEASDLLIRNKPLDTTSHLILFQVGVVGIADFHFRGTPDSKFSVLLDRLEKQYGPKHAVIHYIAAVLPTEEPVVQEFTIESLRYPEAAAQISATSTFYIPPKDISDIDQNAVKAMGLITEGQVAKDSGRTSFPAYPWGPKRTTLNAYGDYTEAAIEQLDKHTTPSDYQPLRASKAMTEVMKALSLDSSLVEKYKQDPSRFVEAYPKLSQSERAALKGGRSWEIRCAMKNMPLSFLTEGPGGMNQAPTYIVTIEVIVVFLLADETVAEKNAVTEDRMIVSAAA